MTYIPTPPENEEMLLKRAQTLAGLTLISLANQASQVMPLNIKRDKGWIGKLLEFHLGASAGNKAKQDFSNLGIEMKTIPVNHKGKPLETTFLCVASLIGNIGETWNTSYVRKKIARVLWIPVEGEPAIPLNERRMGAPFLWSPSPEEDEMLGRDWEELMDMIVLGEVERITARYGSWLQIRPKAANSNVLTEGIGTRGQPVMTVPRGFYLKKSFTGLLLARQFLL